ncbi:hypothetical protein B0I21_11112 [Sphingobacterium paludis]|uniref:Uncharacterized protein n=1 Tax=Sphingobacterium paludis TaxID=1476465 RepID=A0A4V3E0W6_9SPHI|nr:hypothetical protein B0I21_11112 [Sphingobacterium paludis]
MEDYLLVFPGSGVYRFHLIFVRPSIDLLGDKLRSCIHLDFPTHGGKLYKSNINNIKSLFRNLSGHQTFYPSEYEMPEQRP